MECDNSHNNSLSSRASSSPSPPRERCKGRFAGNDHEELILHILQRVGSKSYSVLKKLTKQPEITSEEWEVDKLLDIMNVNDGEWFLLKWKDWPASFASWERGSLQKLDPALLTDYEKRKKIESNHDTSASDSEAMEDGNNNATAAPKKRVITSEELSDMARSLAKHISWPVFLKMMQRLDKEMNLGILKKEEDICRKDLHLQHITIPIGLSPIQQSLPKGLIHRKRLEWKLSQLEQVHIQIINDEDDEPIPQLPPGFEYIVTNRYSAPDIAPDILESLVGCSCKSCIPGTRKCCSQQAGVSFAYRDDLPNTLLDYQRSQAIYECTSRCKCSLETCSNRVLQKGLTTPMQLFKTKGRGWGLKTLKAIKCGEFVIEYVGQVITSAQADEREGNEYLFDLDFNPEGDSQYTIDAMTLGNLSRFINSRCADANLSSLAVYVDCQHPDLPRIGFFANRDIERLEELTFDYMMTGGSAGFQCLCGSAKCRGTINLLPVDQSTTNATPNDQPAETNSAPRPKKGPRQRRRGKKANSLQPPQLDGVNGVNLNPTELSPPGSTSQNWHNHSDFDASLHIDPLKSNSEDVIMASNGASNAVIDLIGSPNSGSDNMASNFVDDEEESSEVWHNACESDHPANIISLSDAESPLKPPMVPVIPQSPTASTLLSEQHQNSRTASTNACAISSETSKSNTANIDLMSEPDSVSSGEKEDQNFLLPMEIVEPAVINTTEQA